VVVGDLQNETGDPRFDSTLDAAFRLGMQQSQYVNVLSELQVRQTLALMEQPKDTNVNRAVGSEIAQREHAKALILPTVSNYGRGVRITAELIDPQTQLTINSQSVNVSDANDAVAAVDTLVQQLRGSLGESLAQIRNSSTPLAQATTSNLEALRAFSLATEATGRGDAKLSLDLLHHALKLDPNFALAYAEIGANYLSTGQRKLAQHAIEEALKRSARLSNRERARLQAQKVTSYGTMVEAVQAWKVVADLYPDEPTGPQNVGLFLAANLNDCAQALPYLRQSIALPHAAHAASQYTAATCELALGHEQNALRDFKKAAEGGFAGPFLGLADTYVELGRYDEATKYVDSLPHSETMKVSVAQRRALIAVDQGDLPGAERALRSGLLALDPRQMTSQGWYLRLDLVGVLWGEHKSSEALATTRADLDALFALSEEARGEVALDYPTLVAAYSRWAARLGDPALAERGLAVVRAAGDLSGYPVRAQLAAVTEAELALYSGDPSKALHITAIADIHPLWELLDVIARTKAATRQPDAGAAFTRVLNSRGLAFGELYENNLGICTRVLQWNLDRLQAARWLAKSDAAGAAQLASAFSSHWPLAAKTSAAMVEAESLANAWLSEDGSTGTKAQ
jgi:putative peptide modification system cyclase